jgi:hypothetical protein
MLSQYMKQETIGILLIILGVLAWPVGLYAGFEPVPNILVPHLCLVLPGVYLRGSKILKRVKGND